MYIRFLLSFSIVVLYYAYSSLALFLTEKFNKPMVFEIVFNFTIVCLSIISLIQIFKQFKSGRYFILLENVLYCIWCFMYLGISYTKGVGFTFTHGVIYTVPAIIFFSYRFFYFLLSKKAKLYFLPKV